MKIIGKPYSGKPNVRFDEGELEIEPFGYYASSLLYCKIQIFFGRQVGRDVIDFYRCKINVCLKALWKNFR